MNDPGVLEPLLAVVPVSASTKADLIGLMCGPDRQYHGADHLALLWDRHRRYAVTEQLPASVATRVACAIAYHDAIYVAGRSDNEKRSAELWMAATADRQCRISQADRLWVAETIEATHDHVAAGCALDLTSFDHRLRQWVLDLDLTPLGEEAALFRYNTMLLRREAKHIAERRWRESTKSYMSSLASAQRLYGIATLGETFEAPARRNIQSMLLDDAGSLEV